MAECVRRKNVKQFHAFVTPMGRRADNLISSERLASLLCNLPFHLLFIDLFLQEKRQLEADIYIKKELGKKEGRKGGGSE